MYKKDLSNHPSKKFCAAPKIAKPVKSNLKSSASAFDDNDDIWDDIDISVVEDCILKETQALSQIQSTSVNQQQFPLCSTQKPPSRANVTEGRIFSFPNGSDFKPSNAFPQNKFQPVNNEDLTKLKQEKKELKDELLFKEGEVSNLRNELRRKETVIQAERLEHCAAIEAAEQRGKDKIVKSITDFKAKISNLQKELEKSQSDVIFKKKEIDELTTKCRRFEQQGTPSSKKFPSPSQGVPSPSQGVPSCTSPLGTFRKVRSDSKAISPGKRSFNFNERFDFSSPKRISKTSLKDNSCQTDQEGPRKVKHHKIDTSTKGIFPHSRKASLALSSLLKDTRDPQSSVECVFLPSLYTSLLCLRVPEYSLLEQTESLSPETTTLIMRNACKKLKEVRESLNSKRESLQDKGPAAPPWMKEGISIKYWYKQSCLTYIKAISICNCRGDALHDAIKEILSHLTPLVYEVEMVNADIGEDCLQCLSLLGDQADSSLPKSLCNNVLSSLMALFENCPPEQVKVFGICRVLISFSSIQNFNLQLCNEASQKCFLGPFCQFLCDNRSYFDFLQLGWHLVEWISLLLTKPPFWLSKAKCSCSFHLLTALLTILESLLPMNTEIERVHAVTKGIRLLHRWQLIDPSLFEKVGPMSRCLSIMSTISHMSKSLKRCGLLDHASVEVLLDLYEEEESQ